ncbi:hypothetical protein [Chitinophaga varians]|uniref:hypothetical protein n=1 Tax=Chitinophaga varians TaxID=2202339 RepID=UPI00165F561E|nr:hypothetical protein [Chitinophaga varians]MBC9913154.1 hypothetical protein [Chitinophaga varians]
MENSTNEIIEDVSPQIVYLQDKAAIDMQIATAKAYPRNIKRSLDNAIAIVTMDQETAKTCTYSVPRGGKPITGPSVHLAKILSQVWGNLRIESKVVSIDNKQVTSEAVCFDLENNLAIKAQVKRSIMGKTGRYSDDMITVTGNAANSIALRNAVLSVIPRAIVDKVYAAAKQAITGDVSDEAKLIARRKQVVDGLKDTFSVTEQEILGAIGKAAITHITSDDLVVLIGIGTAIKDGDTTIEQAFRGGIKPQTKTPQEIEAERIMHLINDADSADTLEKIRQYVMPAQMETFNAKLKSFES